MAESYFLLAATFIPLLLAPVAYVIGRRAGSTAVTWFSFGVLAISTGLLFIPTMLLHGGMSSYAEDYKWGQFGDFGLKLDGLALPFALIIYVLCTVLALYSKPYMIHKIMEDMPGHPKATGASSTSSSSSSSSSAASSHESHSHGGTLTLLSPEQKHYVNSQMGLYFGLYLAFSMGMLGTVLATNVIEFYVFFELMLVPSFFLIAFYGYGARRRIALMFFFWTHVGAVVLLLSLLSMGFFAGGYDYTTIKANASHIPQQWLALIVFGLVAGLGVKLAAFLLHIWLPYAHAEAPTPVSALLSPAMIGIGAYGLLRLWMELLTGSYEQYSLYINMWGLATMIYGGAMAMMQDDIKKVLAYSSISQMGYILFGLGSGSMLGISGATMLYVSHGLGKAVLFMMAGSIILQTGTRSLSKLGGLAGRMPYTAVIAFIGALTIMGVPPTSGFMAEWTMFNGALQTAAHNGDWFRAAMFGFGIMATILTSAYILWMLKRVFFGKVPEEMAHVKEASPYITVTMLVFAALSLTVGILPDLFLNPITGYVQGMFAGHENVLPLPTHPAASEATSTITPAAGGLGHESDGVSVHEGISVTAQTTGGNAGGRT